PLWRGTGARLPGGRRRPREGWTDRLLRHLSRARPRKGRAPTRRPALAGERGARTRKRGRPGPDRARRAPRVASASAPGDRAVRPPGERKVASGLGVGG